MISTRSDAMNKINKTSSREVYIFHDTTQYTIFVQLWESTPASLKFSKRLIPKGDILDVPSLFLIAGIAQSPEKKLVILLNQSLVMVHGNGRCLISEDPPKIVTGTSSSFIVTVHPRASSKKRSNSASRILM